MSGQKNKNQKSDGKMFGVSEREREKSVKKEETE